MDSGSGSRGSLGLPTGMPTKAIAALAKFASGGESSPDRKYAETAIEKLRAARKPVDDFKNLRKEVTDLKKSNQDLVKQLEDLRKRFEAAAIPDAEPDDPSEQSGKKVDD